MPQDNSLNCFSRIGKTITLNKNPACFGGIFLVFDS